MPQPTNQQPTGHQISHQGLYLPEKTKNAYILGKKWPKLSIFWMEQTRWFAYIRKPPCIVFWTDMAPNGPKGQKCKIIGTLILGNQ